MRSEEWWRRASNCSYTNGVWKHDFFLYSSPMIEAASIMFHEKQWL